MGHLGEDVCYKYKGKENTTENELHTVEKKNMSVNDYALKIKSICESLASINVTVDDDDKVEVCLRGLGPQYKAFRTSIQTRENIPTFADLVSMLIIEEKNLGEDTSSQSKGNSEQQVFYSNTGRGRGRGRGRGGQGGGRTGNQQSSSSKVMMGSSNTQVDEASLEVGGVKELVDFKDSKMTGAVTIVVSLGMYRLIVIRGKRHEEWKIAAK